MARGEIHIQLYVDYADDPKMRALVRFKRDARGARDLYVAMTCYCRRTQSDGHVPTEQLGILVFPDPVSVGEKQAAALVEVGLCEVVGGGWYLPGYLKRNPSKAQIEQAAQEKARKGREANHRRWHVDGRTDPGCEWCAVDAGTIDGSVHRLPTASGNRSVDRSSDDNGGNPKSQSQSQSQSQVGDDPPTRRDDIEKLCSRLADHVVRNGGARPTITAKWRDAARLLFDRDKRPVAEVVRILDWSQQSDFWRANVLSLPKFREKYDQLRLQMERSAATGTGRPLASGDEEWMR